MLVKVCGMRDAHNIRCAESLGIDIMGFIFYEKSKRFAGSEAPPYLPSGCRRAGVFVNSSMEHIAKMTQVFSLDIIQLHGEESPEFCRELSAKLPQVSIIKAFSIAGKKDIEKTAGYEGCASMFLFDTATIGYGGSGRSFDWDILQMYMGRTPFLLSGGISPESLPQLENLEHPMWAGVDLNSRFETSPGIKDISKLREFIEGFRASINKKEII